MLRNPTGVIFVLDENIGTSVALGIQDAGGNALLFREVVPQGTPDVEWLPRVRDWGHAVITRDVAMR